MRGGIILIATLRIALLMTDALMIFGMIMTNAKAEEKNTI